MCTAADDTKTNCVSYCLFWGLKAIEEIAKQLDIVYVVSNGNGTTFRISPEEYFRQKSTLKKKKYTVKSERIILNSYFDNDIDFYENNGNYKIKSYPKK